MDIFGSLQSLGIESGTFLMFALLLGLLSPAFRWPSSRCWWR